MSIVTHLLNHGEVLDLSTLNCSEDQWLEVDLQDRSTAVRNTSRNDVIITLTNLQQQAKFICLDDTSDDVIVEDDVVEQIVYVLADYEPIRYISPAANGTIPPPLPPGHRFEYDCSATARPTPSVYWYDDWYPYHSSDRRRRIPIPNGERLIIAHLQNQLFDTYAIACVAENVWEKRFRWIKYPDIPPSTTGWCGSYTHINMHTCTLMYTYVHAYIHSHCTHVHSNVHIHTCTHTLHTCTLVCTIVHTHTCTLVCTIVHIHTCTLTHSHMHTCMH